MMKHIAFMLVIISILLSLSGCAKPNYYQNNGVHYFTKPDRELSAYLPFKANDDDRMMCGDGLLIESTLYLPAWKMQKGGVGNNVFIYAYDTKKQVLSDSLMLTNPKGLSSVSRIVKADGLYLIGIYTENKVRKLVVIKTDNQLESYKAYPLEVEAVGIKEAAISDNELNILIYAGEYNVKWVKINTGTMQPKEVKTFNSKQLCVDTNDGYLYVASNITKDKTLSIERYRLNKPEADPEVIAFPFKLSGTEPDSTRQIKLKVTQDTALLTYTNQADIDNGEAVTTLMKLNLKTREYKTIDIPAYTFNVMEDGDSITVFKSVFKPSYKKYVSWQALAISRIDADLTLEKELLCFIPSVWNYAFQAYKLPDNQLAMVGTYQMISKKTQRNSFIPFVGFYRLR